MSAPPPHKEAVDSDDVAAFVFATFTGVFITGWLFISMGAVRDLFGRWRGCCGGRHGSYNLHQWEVNAMETLLDDDAPAPLPPEVHRKVAGFQSLTEACALVHRPGSFAHRNRLAHRVCAMVTTFMLPVNLIVFEYTARDFHCVSQQPWGTRSHCDDLKPPDQRHETVLYHVWGVVGLALPVFILAGFWYIQDRPDWGSRVRQSKMSHFERIIRLTKQADQALLARSMDKWATITLSAMGVNAALIGLNVASDMYMVGGTGLGFFMLFYCEAIILAQECLVVSTLLTTALHVRVARKITLLNLRRKFQTLDKSKLFMWMRTREEYRDFANSFLDKVLQPFAASLQWVIWFVAAVLALLVLNILLFCIFPFGTRWLLGGYESAFFLAIGIEGAFFFMAYTHMQSAIDQVLTIRHTLDDLGGAGVEPMLLLLETLGFQGIDTLRRAQQRFQSVSGGGGRPTSAVGIVNAAAAAAAAAAADPAALRDAPFVPFEVLRDILKAGGATAASPAPAELGEEGWVDVGWKRLAVSIGLPEAAVDDARLTERTEQLADAMMCIKEVEDTVAAAAGAGGTSDADERVRAYANAAGTALKAWSTLVGVDDPNAVAEFTEVLVPRFVNREAEAATLNEFLRARLQVSEPVRNPLVASLERVAAGGRRNRPASFALD